MTSDVVILIVLLMLSGFFSSAETALFSISKTRARHLAKKEARSYKLIKQMKDDPHRLLSTILIGNNVVNVGSSAMATSLAMQMFPHNAVGIVTGVMTFLILVFGEVFPKSVATRNNVLIARMVIYPVYWLSLLFMPVIVMLNFIPKLTGKIKQPTTLTEEDLKTFVEAVEEEGEIKEEEKEFIENIFEFDDTNASEIMTPRTDMFVIDINEPLDLKAIADSGFTRIPVVDDDLDHVIGVINIKDLFMHQVTSDGKIDIRKLMRPAYFVPENKKLDKLLHQFKKSKNHLAIIVDEHGGVAGLISLEDLLEEIVGEIRDETDPEEPGIIKVKKDEWIVPGKAEIDEVNEQLPMEIPDSPEYDTFSGFVLSRIGRIPREKEKIPIGDFEVTVRKMDGNRIVEYHVKHKRRNRQPPTGEGDAAATQTG